MGAGKVALAAGVAFLLTLGGTVAISSASASCGGGSVNLSSVSTSAPIAGYSGDQLVIAGTIINAAAQLELDTRAATIAVMTGMGESSLRHLTHGDAVDHTTIGVFQQGESYGPPANRRPQEGRHRVPQPAGAGPRLGDHATPRAPRTKCRSTRTPTTTRSSTRPPSR